MRSLTKLFAVVSVLSLAACGESTTGLTADETASLEAARAELALAATDLPEASRTDSASAPERLLLRLTGRALQRLERMGAVEAKERAITELRAKQEALRAAIESRDPEAIRRAKHEFDGTAARVVVHVFTPRIVPEVIQMVSRQVRTLRERIDQAEKDGRDVAGPRRVLAHVAGILAESRAAMERGNPIAALMMAAHASDVLHTMFHR